MEDVRPKTFGAETQAGARPDWALGFYDLIPRRADTVVVTEGPFGAVAARRIAPATFLRGSALHDGQMRLLTRWRRIVFLPDGDAAGRRVEQQLGPLIQIAALGTTALREVRVVRLADHVQPDDLSEQALGRALDDHAAPQLTLRPALQPQPLRRK